jgi:hypothetical protein
MKRTTLIILFAIFSILLITLSCTLPIYIVTDSDDDDDDDNEVVKVITATPEAVTEEVVPTQANTPTYAVTPTVSVSLDGPWTIWQGTDQQQLDIDFLQDGYSVIGNAATDDGYSILYKGAISHDSKTVSGEWESTNGLSGNFVMYLDGSFGVFSGNMGGGVPFCGTRTSGSQPSPCLQ